jgi:hypothetical protein
MLVQIQPSTCFVRWRRLIKTSRFLFLGTRPQSMEIHFSGFGVNRQVSLQLWLAEEKQFVFGGVLSFSKLWPEARQRAKSKSATE